MSQDSLGARIARQIQPAHRLRITAAETADAILLSGIVPTEQDRAAAARVAATLAPGKRVENLLEVERILPDDRIDRWGGVSSMDPLFNRSEGGQPYDPDNPDTEVNDQPLNTDVLQAEDAGVQEDDPGGQVEPDPTFYAPTDPVLARNDEGSVDVLNGFAPGSMDEMTVNRSAEDRLPGDEALVTAIRRELREDALTTTLRIDVVVEDGVAHLRGRVSDLMDAENAEEVANRVPGVREVIEELDVAPM